MFMSPEQLLFADKQRQVQQAAGTSGMPLLKPTVYDKESVGLKLRRWFTGILSARAKTSCNVME